MKHIYAGHYENKRPDLEDEYERPLHPQLEKFYKKWGKDYTPEGCKKDNEMGIGALVESDVWRLKTIK